MRRRNDFTKLGLRRGLSLLEVMLAIAIFGGALVVLGQLIRIGSMSAATARDLTEAQRHCNSLMAEVAAGILPPDAVSEAPVEGAEGWQYSLTPEPRSEEGLLSVTIEVSQDPNSYNRPVRFSLVRWMVDPAVAEEAAAAAEDAAATTGSGASGSTSTSGSSAPASAPSSSTFGSPMGSGGASGS